MSELLLETMVPLWRRVKDTNIILRNQYFLLTQNIQPYLISLHLEVRLREFRGQAPKLGFTVCLPKIT
jgi:hypothetical protein